ncbi:MAG: nucleotidyltransferase family protein [Anaerolineaceae bacterium]|nr:nucleotidyltransferase family protein [Anaerolineaceae bacterium]
MNRENVIILLHANMEELRHLGIRSISLFGSVARGKSVAGSDIDLLVDLEPPHTFDRYTQALFFIEDLLGCPIDLVMQETLKPRARPSVEQEAIHVT